MLGNLPPSSNCETGPLQLSPRLVAASMQDPCIQRPILDRLNTLVSAIRESDVAHSTKVSGLGQLIASIQERIVQAVEDSTNAATAENAALVTHIGGIHGTLESLATRLSLGADERIDLSSIKETVGRIDQAISTKVEDSLGDRIKDAQEMKAIIVEETDGLKRAIQDLALKLDHTTTKNDVLDKLDALTETVTLAGTPSSRGLDLMTEFVQQVKEHISSLPAPNLDLPVMDTTAIIEKLDLISDSMTNPVTTIDLSAIQATLEDIRELSQAQQISDTSPTSTTHADISDVLMKLDGITAMCQSIMVARTDAPDSETNLENLREAQQILLNALKEDAEHRTAQAQQTAELVRYSNELNAWLEKFVTNASMQMDGVGAGLGAIRRDLGLDPLPTDGQEDTNASPQGVIRELRAMFEEQIKSAGDIAATLNALLVAFNEEQERSAQARENLATDSVLRMIEVQRQEQGQLLKQLASDLSSDIRGERIRFVEAMSQATSMNVQLHVEEFKKQLTHEVLALTDEVGRLREERKTIQHQIAQLFLVKSEHEAECCSSDAPQPPPRPLSSTRPRGR
ncbi:unnamed protein product [Rhizoctonia solani]|uniref:Uncharacterized protein n=1 Tax=Rhizoctonia solani TaxID=456999 RepID=A0A8H3GU09_9AGAM|nr:unnamed protein product [Rhizoctonia solani]